MTKRISGKEDTDLVSDALGGDAGAFGQLVERHFGRIFAVAYSRLGNRDEAEELTQEALLRAYLHLDKLKTPGRFPQWVGQIARNLARDWQRKEKRKSSLIQVVPLDAETREVQDVSMKDSREEAQENETAAMVRESILKLPPVLREVVLLRFSEGLEIAEIAGQLDVHRTTVSYRLKKALKIMKGMLEAALFEGARSIRPRHAAAIRTVAIVTVVSAMSTKAKASLAAAGSVSALASSAGSKVGLLSSIARIIRTIGPIKTAVMTGGTIMGVSKSVIIGGTVTILAFGGIFAYKASEPLREWPSEEESVVVLDEDEVVRILNEFFPHEVYEFLLQTQRDGRAELDPDGELPTVLECTSVGSRGNMYMGVHWVQKNTGVGSKRIHIGNTDNPEMIAILDGSGNPLEVRIVKQKETGPGKYAIYVELKKTWERGELLTLFIISERDGIIESNTESPLTLMNFFGSEAVQQFALILTDSHEVIEYSEEPYVAGQIQNHEVRFWQRKVASNETYRVDLTIRKKDENSS